MDGEYRREAAPWWRPADWAVQAEPMRVEATVTTRPNVDLRVLLGYSFTLHDEHLVTGDSIGEFWLSDPDDIAWQIEVFTRLSRAALDPTASRAVLDGPAVRFADR